MVITDVIKYEGDNQTFVWKHPAEDFNMTTQLIVHESQEALFFLNGQALDLFGAGRHTLESQNIPLIREILNLPVNAKTAFHCEVYFTNKTEQMAIKWGTDSRVQFLEPTYNFPLSLGASGEMNLRIEDSRKLLVKIVGTEKNLTQESLFKQLKAFLMTKVKAYLAQIMKEEKINIFEIDSRLEKLSKALKLKIYPDFLDYGISLERFFVTNIVKPDGDAIYEKFKDLYYRQYGDIAEAELKQKVGVIEQTTDKKKTVISAEATAEKRKIEGYTYQQERSFDVAEKAASNEGSGNFTAAGIGMGVMAGIGNSVGGAIGGTFNEAMKPMDKSTSNNKNKLCSNCGTPIDINTSFCQSCGMKITNLKSCPKCNFIFKEDGKFCPNCGIKREDNNDGKI